MFISWNHACERAPERLGALEAFERAARAASQWAGFIDAITARLAVLDSLQAPKTKKRKKRDQENGGSVHREERRTLRSKQAEVFAREMGRIDEAIAIYRSLVEDDESDESAVQTLDRILRESDHRDDLRWLFEIRVDRANTAHKIDLLSECWLNGSFARLRKAVALRQRHEQVGAVGIEPVRRWRRHYNTS